MIKLDKFSSFYVANWKLNGDFNFIDQFKDDLKIPKDESKCIVVCPTSIHLYYMSRQKLKFYLGAQNISQHQEGAFTGEISSKALCELKINFCIVGHSERRQFFHETNKEVKLKSSNLINNEIIPIICVGETLEEKESGKTNNVIKKQLEQGLSNYSNSSNTVIAYEPVWAIGTGITPSLEEIDIAHKFIRESDKRFNKFKIIYGGSVKGSNAKEIIALSNVDGALIGGASLKSEEFNSIIQD